MNSVLEQIYGLDKTAAESGDELTLNDVSAADLLAAHAAGEVDINDYLPTSEEGEKVAEDEEGGFDLSSLSDEELQAALAELEGSEKIASEEAEYWDAAGRQMARSYADELTKQASMENTMDLNELSAEEIIGLAYELADEMDKTASEYEEDEIDLNAMTPDEIIELAYHLENGFEDESEKVAGIDLNELSVDEFMGFAAELEQEVEMEKEAARGGKIMAALRDAATAKQFRGGLAGRRAAQEKATRAGQFRAKADSTSSKKVRYKAGEKARQLSGQAKRERKLSLKQMLAGGGKTGLLYGGAGGSLIAAGRASKR